jgi:F-type H+-transporting ATPase subunit delta
LIVSVVAKRYAKALVALARDHRRLAETGEQLKRFTQLIEDTPSLKSLLYNPVISQRFKMDLLTDLNQRLGLGTLEANFVRTLLEKGRLPEMPHMVALYEVLAEEAQNRLRVRVTSAFPLSPALQEEVRQRFAHYTSKDIVLDQEIDPTLIGGMVAQMGSFVLDGSIRHELARLKTALVGDHRGGLA